MSEGVMSGFTGILVQRHYKPGEKYVQLVFQTAEGAKLSLSRNVKMVRSMSVGQTYQVRGPQRTVGGKVFIHEPLTSVVKPRGKRRAILVSIIMAIVLAIAGGIILITGIGGEKNQSGSKQEGIGQSQGIQSSEDGNVMGVSTEENSSQDDTAALENVTSPTSELQSGSNTTSVSANASQSRVSTPAPAPAPAPAAAAVDPAPAQDVQSAEPELPAENTDTNEPNTDAPKSSEGGAEQVQP